VKLQERRRKNLLDDIPLDANVSYQQKVKASHEKRTATYSSEKAVNREEGRPTIKFALIATTELRDVVLNHRRLCRKSAGSAVNKGLYGTYQSRLVANRRNPARKLRVPD